MVTNEGLILLDWRVEGTVVDRIVLALSYLPTWPGPQPHPI